MKVYVATKGYDHEGDFPIGVFKSEKSARECGEKNKASNTVLFSDAIYSVEEFELEE